MRALLASAALLLAPAPLVAQQPEGERKHAVTGEWVVDLRLSFDDAPYTQPMRLEVARDKSIKGTFYGSKIEAGRLGEAQGRSCIAFRTSDNSGPYQHAACLVEGKLVGQSWSEGRDFVNPWTAERKK